MHQENEMRRFAIVCCLLAFVALAGCAENVHKPTTVGNAGTAAMVAYSVAGMGVSQYLALPLCAKPPVYPCKTQAANDNLAIADTAAYTAAVAVDQAASAAAAVAANQKATAANKVLSDALKDPAVKLQLDMMGAVKP
jgi:hypothetical protein